MFTGTIRFQIHLVWLVAVVGLLIVLFFYINSSSTTSVPSKVTYDHHITNTNLNTLHGSSSRYNHTYPLSPPIISNGIISFKLAVIADLDTDSRLAPNKDEWRSYLKKGYMSYNTRKDSVAMSWDDEDNQELISNFGHKGRGMELSELVIFNGRLLTVDDRTGIVYEISNNKVYPWIILTDGNGRSVKGFKSEWATVKDEYLYVGSMGKEWTSGDGEYINDDPMFIKQVNIDGQITSINWANNYKALRKAIGIEFPGYLMHESCVFSDIHKKWFFLPRRCSTEIYSEKKDEKMGCNVLISANDDFSSVHSVRIGELIPTLGYSSFKFVPNTKDNVIVALKSEEVDGKTATFITVFKIDGKILLPDQKISATLKFEGIEFI